MRGKNTNYEIIPTFFQDDHDAGGGQSFRSSTSLSTYIAEEQEIISICEYWRTYDTE